MFSPPSLPGVVSEPPACPRTTFEVVRLLQSMSCLNVGMSPARFFVSNNSTTVEAGFPCYDNAVIMRTFRRGQEQAERLLRSRVLQRFLA